MQIIQLFQVEQEINSMRFKTALTSSLKIVNSGRRFANNNFSYSLCFTIFTESFLLFQLVSFVVLRLKYHCWINFMRRERLFAKFLIITAKMIITCWRTNCNIKTIVNVVLSFQIYLFSRPPLLLGDVIIILS